MSLPAPQTCPTCFERGEPYSRKTEEGVRKRWWKCSVCGERWHSAEVSTGRTTRLLRSSDTASGINPPS